jgi:hypothetical protein
VAAAVWRTHTHATTPFAHRCNCLLRCPHPHAQPEFWLGTSLGGYNEAGTWVPGFEGYAPYFHRVASALNPCTDGEPQLSGPGWGESCFERLQRAASPPPSASGSAL